MAKRKNTRVVAFKQPEPEEDDEPTPAELAAAEQEIDEEMGLADNAREVPLFADIDGRTSRSIVKLKISKFEPGGPPAYKGMFPTNTTLDTIGQLFGDGIYNIEGLNHRHTVLAVKDSVRIALGTTADQKTQQAQLAAGNTAEADRIERLSRQSAVESRENNQAFLQLVISTTQAAAEREARNHAANQQQMAQYFAAMMAQSQAMFQQTIVMLTTGHAQSMESLQTINKGNAAKQLKPDHSEPKLVDMLLRGMKLGREFSDPGNPKPMWADIMQSGLGLLSNVQQQQVAAQGNGQSHPVALPAPTPSARVLSPAVKKRIQTALRFYETVRSKGIDPEDFIRRLSEAEALAPTPTNAPQHAEPAELAAFEREHEDDEPDTEDEDEENDVLDDDDRDVGEDEDDLDDGEEESEDPEQSRAIA